MQEEYGFKVCREIEGKYFSGTECGRVIEYRVGFEASPEPDCGPLAVFDAYKQAMEFMERERFVGRPLAVFLCAFQPSEHDCLWPWCWGTTHHSPITKQHNLPIGTILADKVMLLHRPLYRITLEELKAGR